MKKQIYILTLFALCVCTMTSSFGQLAGAWQQTLPDGRITIMILADNYVMISRYENKKFLYTEGGVYRIENKKLIYTCEFNSADSMKVGNVFTQAFKQDKAKLSIDSFGDWQRLDEGKTPAAAIYRITGRMGNDGNITPMQQRGARKTLKILSDTHFQWAAINPETKQFSGTGGGTYTIKDGKYTETIEFFSRDNNRVGASLTFDYELKDGKDWHHSGLSSAGAKIYEVWSKEK